MTNEKGTIIKSALKYLVKRQIEEGSVGFAVDNDHDHDCCWDDVLAWIEAQPCDDCISRQASVKGLTELINNLKGVQGDMGGAVNSARELIKTLPPVTPTSEDIKEAYFKGYDYGVKDWFRSKTQPCEDCISRQAVIDYAKDTCLDLDKDEDTEIFCDEIKAMTPVTPERPKGKWMECGGDEPWLKGYCCSLCNFTATNKYNYCPDCGAEMSGGGEDANNN